ncbi:hypothetical protein [Calidifontibacillus erzurumensis]|uniref:Uncharacterized protein n=1 Tax=Calidifontibacillus erzurumensis TaxID=2741433 RepID=A0A8J8GCI4_9BACI|nr:hypothetical protein [Calidifontibacillus erzurumensis]NSL51014.1 hypothetical protein [Calidifontibacillus erzurumensis]
MDELTKLQLLTEAVLEFRTQLRNANDVNELGQMVLDIMKQAKDRQLIELVQEAYEQRENRQNAIHILTEAITYLHGKIDQLQKG